MHGVITDLKLSDLWTTKKDRILDFSPDLYLGESIKEKKLDTIKKKLLTKPLLANVTLLVLSENSSDQVEILGCAQLAQKIYGEYPLCVIGLAGNRDEAVDLIVRITQDCLSERGDCSLKEFLTWR